MLIPIKTIRKKMLYVSATKFSGRQADSVQDNQLWNALLRASILIGRRAAICRMDQSIIDSHGKPYFLPAIHCVLISLLLPDAVTRILTNPHWRRHPMARHRLFISQTIASGETLCLDDEQGHYLSRVLRLKPGNEVVLFDDSGYEYPSIIDELEKKKVLIRAGKPTLRESESPLQIRLIQGISRGERMDFVIQKATELGVHRITPILTEYSVVKLKNDRANKRLLHWQKIAQSACEQCGRNKLPIIDEPAPLHEFLSANTTTDCRLLLQPTANHALHEINDSPTSLDLLIGPEGGISNKESELLSISGFTPVSLGPRTLRTETAALAAIAILQSHYGDL